MAKWLDPEQTMFGRGVKMDTIGIHSSHSSERVQLRDMWFGESDEVSYESEDEHDDAIEPIHVTNAYLHDAYRRETYRTPLGTWFKQNLEEQYTNVANGRYTRRLQLFCLCMAGFFFIYVLYGWANYKEELPQTATSARLFIAFMALLAFVFMRMPCYINTFLSRPELASTFASMVLLTLCIAIMCVAVLEQDLSPPIDIMLVFMACYGCGVMSCRRLSILILPVSAAWLYYVFNKGSVHIEHSWVAMIALTLTNILGIPSVRTQDNHGRRHFSANNHLIETSLALKERKPLFQKRRSEVIPRFIKYPNSKTPFTCEVATVCVIRVCGLDNYTKMLVSPKSVREILSAVFSSVEQCCPRRNIRLVQADAEHLVFVHDEPQKAHLGHSEIFRMASMLIRDMQQNISCSTDLPFYCIAGIGSGTFSAVFVGVTNTALTIEGTAITQAFIALDVARDYVQKRAHNVIPQQRKHPLDDLGSGVGGGQDKHKHTFSGDDDLISSIFQYGENAPIAHDVICVDAEAAISIKRACNTKTAYMINGYFETAGTVDNETFVVPNHSDLVKLMTDARVELPRHRSSISKFREFRDPGALNKHDNGAAADHELLRSPQHVASVTDTDTLLNERTTRHASNKWRKFISMIPLMFSSDHYIGFGGGKAKKTTLCDVCSSLNAYWCNYAREYKYSSIVWMGLGICLLVAFGTLDIIFFPDAITHTRIVRYGAVPLGIMCFIVVMVALPKWRTIAYTAWLAWLYVIVFSVYMWAPHTDRLYGELRVILIIVYQTLFVRVPWQYFRFIAWIPIASYSALILAYAISQTREDEISVAFVFQLIASTLIMCAVSRMNTYDDEDTYLVSLYQKKTRMSLKRSERKIKNMLERHFPEPFVDILTEWQHRPNNNALIYRNTAALVIYVDTASPSRQSLRSQQTIEGIMVTRVDTMIMQDGVFKKLTYARNFFVCKLIEDLIEPENERTAFIDARGLFRNIMQVYPNVRAGFCIGDIFLCLVGIDSKLLMTLGGAVSTARKYCLMENENKLYGEPNPLSATRYVIE